MAVLGVSRPRHERPAADIRRRGAMGVPNTKMTVGLLPRSTDHDQRGLDHPDRPAHFYGAGAGASGPGRTMSVDVPCARDPAAGVEDPPIAGDDAPAAHDDLPFRPDPARVLGDRAREIHLGLDREAEQQHGPGRRFGNCSLAPGRSELHCPDRESWRRLRLLVIDCYVVLSKEQSMKSKLRGPLITSAVIALGILRDKFKRVRRRCWQNNKFAAWPFSPRLRPVVLHS